MSKTITDQMIQLAYVLPKTSKQQACDIIKDMIEKDPGELNNLAALYQFFIPPAPGKPKNVFQWVAKAVSTDKTKENLLFVYCDGSNLVATDGHRCHVAKNIDNLDPGFYHAKTGDKVFSLTDNYCPTFPDYHRIIPDFTEYPFVMSDKELIEHDNRTPAYKLMSPFNDTVAYVNKKYYDQATCFGHSETLYKSAIDMVIVKVSDDIFALIMPMIMKKEG